MRLKRTKNCPTLDQFQIKLELLAVFAHSKELFVVLPVRLEVFSDLVCEI